MINVALVACYLGSVTGNPRLFRAGKMLIANEDGLAQTQFHAVQEAALLCSEVWQPVLRVPCCHKLPTHSHGNCLIMTKISRSQSRIGITELARALGRSEMFVRSSLMVLKISLKDESLELDDAVAVIRHLAQRQSDQDELLGSLLAKITTTEKRELEFAVALEMVKKERAALARLTENLKEQLGREQSRSDRLEQNLHDLTASLAHIVLQRDRLVARSKLRSRATLKHYNGRSVLYLEDPVNPHLLNRSET